MKRTFTQVFKQQPTEDESFGLKWLKTKTKRLYVIRQEASEQPTHVDSLEFTPPVQTISESSSEELLVDEDQEEDHVDSLELDFDSPRESSDTDNASTQRYTCTIHLDEIKHLSNEFPSRKSGEMFAASDFQNALIDHIERYRIEHDQKLGLVVISTGLGKTILAILLLQKQIQLHQREMTLRIFPEKPTNHLLVKPKPRLVIIDSKRKKAELLKRKPLFCYLFLVHSKLIRDASYLKFQEHFIAFGFPQSSFLCVDQSETLTKTKLENKQFIFCLFQSFDKLPPDFIRESITHVCIDEVHHLVATTYNQVFSVLSSSIQKPGLDHGIQFILGMTATLHHRDDSQGHKLKEMFKDTVYIDLPWTTAKELNYFPPVSYVECVSNSLQDLETYESFRTQLRERKLSVLQFVSKIDRSCRSIGFHTDQQVSKRTTPEYVFDVYHSFCEARRIAGLTQKKRTIIFSASCAAADRLETLLTDKGYSARSIHYNTKKAKAREALDGFQNGTLAIVINVMMMNEGFDVKGVDCVVLARATESELIFIQQMGRGLRRDYTNTDQNVTILDVCFNLRRRWKRLLQECDSNHLRDLVLCFWNVDSFVGIPEMQSVATGK